MVRGPCTDLDRGKAAKKKRLQPCNMRANFASNHAGSEEEDQQNILVTVQRVPCKNLGQGVILSLLFGELARRSPQHRPKLDVENA